MNSTLVKIIRLLLDELEQQKADSDRLTALEQWQAEVESVWPQTVGGGQ